MVSEGEDILAKHRFYRMSPRQRSLFHGRLGAGALLLNLVVAIPCAIGGLYVLPALFFATTLSVIAPFFDVPSLVRKGRLRYCSLFLLAEREEKGKMTLHGGTLFDYYFALDRSLSGPQRKAYVLAEYLKGLQRIGEQEQEDTKVRGTTYFLNDRTAARVGLARTKTNRGQQLILIFNYFNLMAAMSLVKGRLTFPRLGRMHTYTGTVGDIAKRAPLIDTLKSRLLRES